jgi:two-component system sensor histidine kinase RegB
MYQPLIAVAATLLPGRLVAPIVLGCVAAYSLLTAAYLPIELRNPADAQRLHLFGMWFAFAFSAFIIGWFVVRMTRAIRARDAELAGAREAALRNERVVALGNLAAGAAHELGTPLGTVAIVTGELLQHADLSPDVREELELVRDQVAQCKSILTRLSARAGSSRAEGGQAIALDAWLAAVVDRWRLLRPKVAPMLSIAGSEPAPRVIADATLEQALLNLFNNAADASPDGVEIAARWDAESLGLAVSDRGAGIPDELVARLGREPVESRSDGSGIGVMLAYAAIERCGGSIRFARREGGGTVAEVVLPLAAIRAD